MKRSHFLRISSFLMMLTSLARFFFGFAMINLFATARNMGTSDPQTLKTAGAAFAVLLLGAVTDLICGFVGALNWEEPLHAVRCSAWGAAALLLGVAGNLFQSLTGYGVSPVAWTTGAVMPAVFLAAALHFTLKRNTGR